MKTILSKLTFENLNVGNVPSTFDDNNKYSNFKWYQRSTPKITSSDNLKVLKIDSVGASIYASIPTIKNIDEFKNIDWQVEVSIKVLNLSSRDQGYFGFTNGGSRHFSFMINTNEVKIDSNGKSIVCKYSFKSNTEYNIVISHIDTYYTFMINGLEIGYIEDFEFNSQLAANNSFTMTLGSIDNSSGSYNLSNAEIWNVNISVGKGVKYLNSFTKYGANLISRLNFKNVGLGLESVYNTKQIWVYDKDKVTNTLVETSFNTIVDNIFTLDTVISNKTNIENINLIDCGDYKVVYNYLKIGTVIEPKVVVNEYTTSALDFENGLVDQVSTTVWQKEGTADITSVNKIFGENSFETKALGDSLYTTNAVITGDATPFTIEFYALIKPQESQLYTEGLFITDNRTLSIDKTTRNLMYSVGNSLGKIKIKYNELNKIMITFDGAATRVFVNDILDIIVGTNTGIASSVYSFLSKGDPHWDKVVSLLHFNGVDGTTNTILHDEKGVEWSLIPTVFAKDDEHAFGGSGAYFSGSGAALVGPPLIPALDDWTIELRFKSDPGHIGKHLVAQNRRTSPNAAGRLVVQHAAENRVWLGYNNASGWASINIDFIPSGTGYNSLMVSRVGNMLCGSVNGSAIVSTHEISGMSIVQQPFTIGVYYTENGNSFVGVIDELRITKGVARYTENFTPPTESFPSNAFFTKGIIDNINIHDGIATKVRDYDPYEEFLVVDLAFDGENNSTKIVDNGSAKVVWTANGSAKLSTDQKFDGFSSLYLDGNGARLSTPPNQNLIISNNIDFTISFEFILNDILKHNYVLSKRMSNAETLSQSARGGYAIVVSNKISFFGWYGTSTDNTAIELISGIIQQNVKYKVDIVRKNMQCYLYVNGVLHASDIQTNEFTDANYITYIGQDKVDAFQPARDFNGYIKNFKIYKGVAVIPEDPTGKIQLDFDNNFNDKYGNSTWTNNGVTFDQVNSVKGHAAKFSSNAIVQSSLTQIDFSNHTFELDINPSSLPNHSIPFAVNGHYLYVYIRPTSFAVELYNSGSWINGYGHSCNFVPNQYNNIKLVFKNNLICFFVNGNIIGISPNDLSTYNVNQSIIIGRPSSGSYPFTGYIDNFKSYKEDLLSDVVCYPVNNTNITTKTDIINDSLRVTFSGTTYDPSWYTTHFSHSPRLKNFTAEIEVFVSTLANYNGLLFRSADYSVNNPRMCGYYVITNGNNLQMYKGTNSSNATSTNLASAALPFKDDNYHVIKVVARDSNFKVYYDDIFMFEVNDSTHTIASDFASPCNWYTENIQPITRRLDIYDENGNHVYHKDFKSKIENPINNAAVHLPLETNAINTGFTHLTINSVGNPTYTTVDGKKCIKFESGKYLTIDSNNIFNLGTNSDFYIEFDFCWNQKLAENNYPYLLSNGDNSTGYIRIRLNASNEISLAINNYSPSHIIDYTIQFHTFYKYKIFRKGNYLSSYLYDNMGNLLASNENDSNIRNINFSRTNTHIGGGSYFNNISFDGYMSNFKMFVGTHEPPETYNDKKVLDLDFKPTGKSYLFKDNNNKCVIHPVNITQRDYQDSKYCCTFNGVDQYLQLGKNDLLNFGNDDFVIEIALDVRYLYGQENRFGRLLAPPRGTDLDEYIMFIGEDHPIADANILGGISVVLKEGESPPLRTGRLAEGYNVVTITRSNDLFSIYANGVLKTTAIWANEVNFNRNNNTTIGGQFDTINNDIQSPYKGTIYSIKILRNTTDLSLLENPNDHYEFNESFTLTNGVESVDIVTEESNEHNIKFVSDTDKVTLKVNDQTVEVPKTTDINSLTLFDQYNSNVNDIKLYNAAIYENDEYIGSEPIDTEFCEIDEEDDMEEIVAYNIGDHNIIGFIEGYENRKFKIFTDIENYIVHFSQSDIDYSINDVDINYIDSYMIHDLENDQIYPINKNEMIKGFISGTINLKQCGVKAIDMKVYCYKADDSYRQIGIYDVDENGYYNIPNLDVNSRYDIIFRDASRKIKDQISNYRKPMQY